MAIMRKCAGCGAIKDRRSMIKITKNHIDNSVVINPSSKIYGRSVYVCTQRECFKIAVKKNRFYKMLKTKINEDVLAKISDALSQ